MRIITVNDIGRPLFQDSAVTIGNFDGVHRGHMELFRQLTARASVRGLESLVVTFEPHPLKVVSSESVPPLITTFDQKAALIASSGVDCLVVVPFTAGFAQMSPDEFVHDLLCRSLGMRHIVIGHDYAFGRGRAGGYETLERISAEAGFTLEYMEPVGEGGVIFSSSLARRLIAVGDMHGTSRILGRYHLISGTIVHGREIGHAIGFPTANIATVNELPPPDGVYAVMVSVAGRLVMGACNIGINPTFGGDSRTIEVYLLDFSDQLYGQSITVWFVQKIREVQRFSAVSELVGAITSDVQKTREILAGADIGLIEPAVYRGGANESQV